MADEKNPKSDPEELTPEQLEQAAGGYSWGVSNTGIKAQDKAAGGQKIADSPLNVAPK
jgi:hypothetical protein